MGVKTRHPYRLGDDDFDTFCYVDMKKFLAGENSLPHRPEHLVALQSSLANAFHVKLDEYRSARNAQKNATSAFGEAATAVREKLRWMKLALPGLTPGSDEILVPFSLDKDISADNDEMKNHADVVYAHWQTVREEPLYAPFQANIDALESDLNAYVVSQANQNAAIQTASLLQNEKDDVRKECEDVLSALIDWYRIYYKSPRDGYWTQTPWGRSSGGGEEEKLPAVENFGLVYDPPVVKLTWDPVDGAEGYLVKMGGSPIILNTTVYDGPETEVEFEPPGGLQYFRVWAKKGDDLGEPGEAISVEVVVESPPPPVNLRMDIGEGNRTKVTWESPEGLVYEGCSLYVVDVPTGNPIPTIPAVPMYHDLIVYSILLGPLAPGTTRYVWVTGEKNGAESEPAGPVWVSA